LTLAEKGYKRSSFATALGLAGPKGLSPAIVSKWEQAVDKTMKEPKIIEIVKKIEGTAIDYKNGADYKKELMENAPVFKEIAASIKASKK
jgi:tripartite-type tricarboxylate transporter receptor subunit TctC